MSLSQPSRTIVVEPVQAVAKPTTPATEPPRPAEPSPAAEATAKT